LSPVLGHAVPFTVVVTPSEADALVREAAPDENYGGGGAGAVAGNAALNPQGVHAGLMDTFMRFDMSALVSAMDIQFGPGRWLPTGAVLTVNEQARPNNDIYNRGQGLFEIQWIDDDSWIEGTGKPKKPTTDGVTWTLAPNYLDPLTDRSLGIFPNWGPGIPDDFRDVEAVLGLPAEFRNDVLAGGPLSLFLTAASDGVGFQFAAKDNKTGPRPRLAITADVIPEPGTLALLLLGGAGGLLRRRRRRCA
jgi:hypothetical protein